MSRGSSGSKKSAGGGIRTKILAFMGTLLVLITLLAGFCLYSVMLRPESAPSRGQSLSPPPSAPSTEKLAALLLEARTLEQQFHKEQAPAGVVQFEEVGKNMLAQALELEKSVKQGQDRKSVQAAAQIVRLVSQYNTSFRKLVQAWEAKTGTPDSAAGKTPGGGPAKPEGLREALRLLGQAEQNYFANRSQENQQRLASAAGTLAEAAGASGLAVAELEAVNQSINNYVLAFDRYQAVSLTTNDPALSSAFTAEQARQKEAMHKASLELDKRISGTDAAQVATPSATPAGQDATIKEITASLNTTYTALQNQIKAISAQKAPPLPGKGPESGLPPRTIVMIIAGIWLLTVLLALLLTRMLTSTVTSPLKRMTDIAHRMAAQDDYSLSFPQEANEFGGLAGALNILVRRQTVKANGNASAVADLTSKTDRVTRLIRDRLNHDTRVVDAFADQEEVLGRVRSAVAQMATDVEELRRKLGGLTEQVRTTEQAVAGCEQSVTAAVENGQAIDQASEQMTGLITAYTDLAEQTSISALNAAIKGARTGPQGREFTKVTEELDRLAKRSAETAKDITRLLHNLEAGIAAGKKLGKQSLQALQQLGTTGSALSQTFTEIDRGAGALQMAAGDSADLVAKLGEISAQADALLRQLNPLNQEVEDALALLSSPAGETAGSELPLEDMVKEMMRDYPEDEKGPGRSEETAGQAGRA